MAIDSWFTMIYLLNILKHGDGPSLSELTKGYLFPLSHHGDAQENGACRERQWFVMSWKAYPFSSWRNLRTRGIMAEKMAEKMAEGGQESWFLSSKFFQTWLRDAEFLGGKSSTIRFVVVRRKDLQKNMAQNKAVNLERVLLVKLRLFGNWPWALAGGLEPWNFMTFHSVGNVIIPTDDFSDFSEG